MKRLFTFTVLLLLLAPANAQSLKLMTYNIRLDVASDGENAWPKRKDFWASQVAFYNPDIFGVQEATPGQVEDISRLLPGYSVVGTGRDGEGKGESSNIFFRKERFSLLKQNTFWLSETPDIISKGWDAAFNRVCTYVLLKDKETGKTFWVFNTHLDHMGESARTNSIQLILSRMETLNVKKLPVFFMGDFNSEPTAQRIKDLKNLMDDSRSISVQRPFGPTGTFNGFRHDEPVTALIDYIFLSKDNPFQVSKYAVLSDSKDLRYPSDHLPVFIEVELRK